MVDFGDQLEKAPDELPISEGWLQKKPQINTAGGRSLFDGDEITRSG